MAVLGVDDFKSKLTGGGARANMFKVTCNFPGYAGGDTELASFLIKGASLPASVVTNIEIPFRGRKLQVAGDRSFEPLSFTVINDTGMEIRNSFERWMDGMNSHAGNTGLSNPTDYQADVVVEQLDRNGVVTKTYNFRGAFPTNVSAIELSYDSENAIEEFTVEMLFQYWESPTSTN